MDETADLPRVLVLVAVYEGREWLDEQLASILGQKGVDVSLLISVDPSSDGSEQLVDAAASRDHRISVLPHGQYSGSAARNFFRLVRAAESGGIDYVAFADQDDLWLPDKLRRAVTLLGSSGADGYSSDVIAFWPDGRQKRVVKSQPQRSSDYLFEAAGPGCTYVLKRGAFECFRELITTRERDVHAITLHDWLCYAHIRASGYRWVIDSEARMLYRQHATNYLGANSGLGAVRSRLAMILDGWWLDQARRIATLTGKSDSPDVRPWLEHDSITAHWFLIRNAGRYRRRRTDRWKMRLVLFGLMLRMLPKRAEAPMSTRRPKG